MKHTKTTRHTVGTSYENDEPFTLGEILLVMTLWAGSWVIVMLVVYWLYAVVFQGV